MLTRDLSFSSSKVGGSIDRSQLATSNEIRRRHKSLERHPFQTELARKIGLSRLLYADPVVDGKL